MKTDDYVFISIYSTKECYIFGHFVATVLNIYIIVSFEVLEIVGLYNK